MYWLIARTKEVILFILSSSVVDGISEILETDASTACNNRSAILRCAPLLTACCTPPANRGSPLSNVADFQSCKLTLPRAELHRQSSIAWLRFCRNFASA